MDAARWERVQAVFHDAVTLAGPERRAFLHNACAGDADLEAAVLRLLEADARGAPLLDRDVAHVARQVLGPVPDALPFTEVGRYTILRILGEGGMGVVYLAERADLGHLVAVKLLRDAWVSPARRERFQREERALAQLNHASIARLYDADTLADGTPWFAMEYVEGVSLTEHCSRTASTLADRLRLFRDVCEAVQHAHQHLILHRDLKPSNILVTPDGRVKLLDFGIAKHLARAEADDQTRTMLRLMTPSYAAPEQLRGDRVGIHTDVYSLGVILYELLAGRRPFDLSHRTPGEAEAIVLDQQPDRPSAASPTSPRPLAASRAAWADLDVLCLTAMHKDPRRRYSTVEALMRDIDRFRKGEPLQARADSLAYRAGKFVRRHRRALAGAGIACVLLAGITSFYTLRLDAARRAALAEAARTQRVQQFMLRLFEGGEHDAAPATDLRVVTLVDRGVQEARGLDGEPAIQAELFHTLGTIYQRLGRYERAEALLRSALDRRRTLHANEADVADSQVALGLLDVERAQLERAEKTIRAGLELAERTLPPEHAAVARATAALGKVLRERGAYQDAIQVLERAVRLYSASPSTARELAANLTSLANAHFYVGHLDESETLNRRVLALDRRFYGERHPSVADDLLNLGAIQSSRGRYADAEGYSRQALDIIRSWYGDDHPETASARTILAQSLMFQGEFAEATALLRLALATQERAYGTEHPRVAFALNELGSVAQRRDELDEAKAAFGRALDIYRKVYDGKHYRVAVAMVNVAGVLVMQGHIARGERLFQDALALYAEVLPPEHLNVGIARIKIGRALAGQKRHKEAEAHLANGYDILKKQPTPSVVWLRAACEGLAAVYDALEKPEQAARFRAELAAPPVPAHD